ncbi:MAG: DMT family transporter [Hyphomicrobiales bacterium]|nr:DMT family transporter [Hyphomicrobiales bacterium]
MVPGGAEAPGQAMRAVVLMLAGVALLSLNDALVKTLASRYPLGELMFVRGLFVAPWILLLARRHGGLAALRVRDLRGQALRGLTVIGASFLFVAGLRELPLADAVAVTFTGPLFITALAPVVLGERVGWRRWLAVLGGFAGVLVMVRPGNALAGGTVQWAVLLPLSAALCGAARDLITRRISRTESSVAVLFFTSTAVMLAGLCTAPLGWSALHAADLWVFAASGTLVAGAYYTQIEAYRLGEAVLVAPFKYTSMVWAVLFGYLIFGHLPDGWTLLGAGVVVMAGLYILHRETRRVRTRTGD